MSESRRVTWPVYSNVEVTTRGYMWHEQRAMSRRVRAPQERMQMRGSGAADKQLGELAGPAREESMSVDATENSARLYTSTVSSCTVHWQFMKAPV